MNEEELRRWIEESLEPPEWERDLRIGAWMILRFKPGTGREEWKEERLKQARGVIRWRRRWKSPNGNT